jgi:ABC-type dipeptide/oligopeptide/nickel transport system permease subunit
VLWAGVIQRHGNRPGGRRLLCAGFVLLVFGVVALLAPVLPLPSPYTQNLNVAFLPPFRSAAYPLGADELGRSELSRLIYGLRPTLFISLGSAAVATLLGTVLGILAAYGPARLQLVTDAAVDVALTFPGFVLAIALVSVLGSNAPSLTLAVALTSCGMVARLARGEVIRVRDRDFITAARAVGVPWPRIAVHHVLPTILGAIVVQFSLVVSVAMLTIAALGFIGLGVQPPDPELGTMVSIGSKYLTTDQMLTMIPGFCLSVLILVLNVLGDGVRDWLDPRR